jgi:hypothetical protein
VVKKHGATSTIFSSEYVRAASVRRATPHHE